MIEFHDVSVSYGKREVLKQVSFSLAPHKITAVIGKNGSGKSTLVSCLTNSVRYTGEIVHDGRNLSLMPLRERAKLIAVLPQFLPQCPLSVKELVTMGRTPYLDVGRRLQKTDRECVDFAIATVGLQDFEETPVDCLSGGEKQKAYLGMVLAQNTRTVVLDEPTTYMDMDNEASFLQLVQSLTGVHKKTLMIVMHNLTKAVEIADRILVLDGGKPVFFGDTQDCVASGIIEKTFVLKRSSYLKDGREQILYYK